MSKGWILERIVGEQSIYSLRRECTGDLQAYLHAVEGSGGVPAPGDEGAGDVGERSPDPGEPAGPSQGRSDG